MSWNKPGGDDKDPWSGRDDQGSPPDLDEAIRSLQKKLTKRSGVQRGPRRRTRSSGATAGNCRCSRDWTVGNEWFLYCG